MKEHQGDMPHYPQIWDRQARITRGAQAGEAAFGARTVRHLSTHPERLAQLEATGAIYRADRGWFVTPERLWLIRRRTPTSTASARAGRTPRTALLSGEKTTVRSTCMQPLALEPFDQV